jgi:hypothetical protein
LVDALCQVIAVSDLADDNINNLYTEFLGERTRHRQHALAQYFSSNHNRFLLNVGFCEIPQLFGILKIINILNLFLNIHIVDFIRISHSLNQQVFTDDGSDCRIDDIIQAQDCVGQCIDRLVEKCRINDSPTRGRINPNELVLFCGDTLCITVPTHDFLGIFDNRINQGNLDLKSRIEVGILDSSESGDNGNLTFLNHKEGPEKQKYYQ